MELVGHIPQGLASITFPEFSLAQDLWSGALGIALMSFTETIAAGPAFVKSEEPPPRANRELLVTGFANVGGAFLGAMPAGGGTTTQTAVNRLAGARTQFAEIVTAGVALATILLLAPLLALMPPATLAAVVIDRTDSTSRVPGDPRNPANGVYLRLDRRCRGRHRVVACRVGISGCRPTGLRSGA